MTDVTEHIPDEDAVSRWVDSPRLYQPDVGLIWKCIFEFPGGVGESVVWRKYKPLIHDVHELGCSRQTVQRLKNPDKSPPWTYTGAITSVAGKIRGLESRGNGFLVEHKPEEGTYHAEISFRVHDAASLSKNDKTLLKGLLQEVFGQLETCECPSQ